MKRINVDWLGKNQEKAKKRLQQYEGIMKKLRKEKQDNEVRTVL